MRPSNKSRSRNKPSTGPIQRRNVGNIIKRVFDSAGPDGKVRGTPQQIIDKYVVLARDAQLYGDRVAAENYQQHAEHYSRLLGEAQRQQQEQRQQQDQQRDEHRPRRDDMNGSDGERGGRSEATASGLTMIDPQDSDDVSGPVDTPESRDDRASKPASAREEGRGPAEAAPEQQPDQPKGQTESEPGPAPKRRARRKPRAEAAEQDSEQAAAPAGQNADAL
jgi:hypothetical protein